eukprot:2987765-Rhodomonas_salina.1
MQTARQLVPPVGHAASTSASCVDSEELPPISEAELLLRRRSCALGPDCSWSNTDLVAEVCECIASMRNDALCRCSVRRVLATVCCKILPPPLLAGRDIARTTTLISGSRGSSRCSTPRNDPRATAKERMHDIEPSSTLAKRAPVSGIAWNSTWRDCFMWTPVSVAARQQLVIDHAAVGDRGARAFSRVQEGDRELVVRPRRQHARRKTSDLTS